MIRATCLALCIIIATPFATGCGTTLSQIEHGTKTIVDTVIADYQKGMTADQIVIDVESQLGAGSTIEEATSVFLNIVGFLVNSGLLAKERPAIVAQATADAKLEPAALSAKAAAIRPMRVDKERGAQ